jgi:hypothetical protein
LVPHVARRCGRLGLQVPSFVMVESIARKTAHTYTVTDADIAWVTAELADTVTRLRAGGFVASPTRGGCAHCSVRARCVLRHSEASFGELVQSALNLDSSPSALAGGIVTLQQLAGRSSLPMDKKTAPSASRSSQTQRGSKPEGVQGKGKKPPQRAPAELRTG